jgi:hypothetical protein
MRPRWAPGLVVSTCLLVCPASAHAYLPFISTDASVVDPRELEVELGYFSLRRENAGNTLSWCRRTTISRSLASTFGHMSRAMTRRATKVRIDRTMLALRS